MGWLFLWWISVRAVLHFSRCWRKKGRALLFFAAEPCGDFICVFILLKVHCGPSNGPHQLSRVVNHVHPGWTLWSRTLDIVVMSEKMFFLLGEDLKTCKSRSFERRGWRSLRVWQIYRCFIIPQKSKLLQRKLLVCVDHKLSQFTDSRALWERWQMLC